MSVPSESRLKQPAMLQSNTLLERLKYTILLFALKISISTMLFFTRLPIIKNYLPAQPLRATSGPPTLKKTYKIRPTLTNRIFIPGSWKRGDAPLPLYLDVHGGGYSLTDPQFDDEFCYPFCNKYNTIVVSIDYRKAPVHRFPTQIDDIVAIIEEVIEDESLPIDRSKVAIGGFSCGGNLVLSVSQILQQVFPGLIKGVVSYYPVADYTRSVSEQVATRPPDCGTDPLAKIMGLCQWSYIPQGKDVRNPLLSVALAERQKLPPKIFIVGCELDLMCFDAEEMAKRFAAVGDGERVGTDLAWECNGVRWEKVLGQGHGFDQFPSSGAQRFVASRRAQELRDSVGKWLFHEVYV